MHAACLHAPAVFSLLLHFYAMLCFRIFFFFFFNDTATTEIYTLSLHDALPISPRLFAAALTSMRMIAAWAWGLRTKARSEEHTSELQSQSNLVCRLLLEKKKKKTHEQKQNKKRAKARRIRLAE